MYDGGKFIVFDNNSKFGTLVKLQKSFPIRMDRIAVQIGRTVITCTLKPDEPKEKLGTSSANLSSSASFFKKPQ